MIVYSLKYIAGVYEKSIANESQHWDILCDIDDGSIKWNVSTVDATFIAEAKSREEFFTNVIFQFINFLYHKPYFFL